MFSYDQNLFPLSIPRHLTLKYRSQPIEDQENIRKPFLIGVSGGSGSGKTMVCEEIMKRFSDDQRVTTISLESFYKPLTDEDLKNVKNYNMDHPNAFDWELLINVLEGLSLSKSVKIPQFDLESFSRLEESIVIHSSLSDVILLEGILLFHHSNVLKYLDMKIFVDTDSDTRLARRVTRDMKYGRKLDNILYQYETFVKPSFDHFILPTKKLSDVVIPRGGSNTVAINVIEQHLKGKLDERRYNRLKKYKEVI